MAYRHVLVLCDGSAEADDAVRAASRLATEDNARLTVVAVAEIEHPGRGCAFGASAWNEVLRDEAAKDLERARRMVDLPAHFAVLSGERSRVVADAARELGCDAIVVARRRRSLSGILQRDPATAVRRRAACTVLQPH
jgi:nucleotide-binding universal stress UspA family protein